MNELRFYQAGIFNWLLCYLLSGNFGNMVLDIDIQQGFANLLKSINNLIDLNLDIPYMAFRILMCFICAIFGSFGYLCAQTRILW